MSDRCPNCDRVDCPTLAAFLDSGQRFYAKQNCDANKIDWRARCLGAEQREAEAVAARDDYKAGGQAVLDDLCSAVKYADKLEQGRDFEKRRGDAAWSALRGIASLFSDELARLVEHGGTTAPGDVVKAVADERRKREEIQRALGQLQSFIWKTLPTTAGSAPIERIQQVAADLATTKAALTKAHEDFVLLEARLGNVAGERDEARAELDRAVAKALEVQRRLEEEQAGAAALRQELIEFRADMIELANRMAMRAKTDQQVSDYSELVAIAAVVEQRLKSGTAGALLLDRLERAESVGVALWRQIEALMRGGALDLRVIDKAERVLSEARQRVQETEGSR